MKTRFIERTDVDRGFTLIELLVVIAIIGTLSSLLMPALSKGKRNAKNVACINQLRQLGIATRMYTDEHENRLPSAELLPSMPLDPSKPLPRICDALGPYVGKTSGGTNESARVFKCPSDVGKRYVAEGSSYEWNIELNGHRMDETRSTELRLIEIEIVNGQEVVKRNEEQVLLFPPETTPLLLDYEDNHPRPPKPAKNVVFMDGHVTGLQIPDVVIKQ
jgi:prepilin-type N-terminal cleavage/methylation domain-containing protein/prepilin-type processing-associated H-X9-DG protein